jgi:DNA polymerase I-like protein with 3'-5' exonuclease and polymerase domains
LTPKIIWDDEQLSDLKNKIKGYPKLVLDTETTWLDAMSANLVGVSMYLDDDNLFYINRLHQWPRVSDKKLHNFLDDLLQSDLLIIGHNIKYDLQIIELFLKSANLHQIDVDENTQINNIKSETDNWEQNSLF